jgi:hypothetical protein
MTLHPVPADLVLAERGIEALPEIDILHRLLVGGAPAVLLPFRDVFGDAVAQVLAVGMQIDTARPLKRFERGDRRRQLHAVVGGIRLAAFELLFVIAEGEDRGPAASPGIGRGTAIGVDDHARKLIAHGALTP